MGFPLHRPRRLRQSDVWRRMVQETRLTMDAFIYPLFIVPGKNVRDAVMRNLKHVMESIARAYQPFNRLEVI